MKYPTPKLLLEAEFADRQRVEELLPLLQGLIGERVTRILSGSEVIHKIERIEASNLFGVDIYFEGREFPFYGSISLDLHFTSYFR